MINRRNTKTLYDLVQNAGKEYGDKVFLRYERHEEMCVKTYKEFADACNSISAWVDEKNAEAGHKVNVALLGRSSFEYLAAMLGSASAGSITIPLDVQLTEANLVDNLNRSDTEILFYDWEFHLDIDVVKEKCPQIKEFICIQNIKHIPSVKKLLKQYEGVEYVSKVKAKDCALIIFTSGTTGRGKGVMLSHGNLIDNTFCTTEKTGQDKAVCLNVLPIHHVFCINGDLLVVLRYGSELCLCKNLQKLMYSIDLYKPTTIRLVPMMAKMLYNKLVLTSQQNPELSMEEVKNKVLGQRLTRIVSGGGYLAESLSMNFAKLGIQIAQGYGMSECSPKISAPDYDRIDKLASVGKLVDKCQVRIVDGEIQVKSPSVMMGYYKEPDKTAEAITKDGWLCTGDLGYLDDENFLYLTGRKKNLIILSNGENVSPEEIEKKFDGDVLISDILVFGAGETIAAEVYPNYEYAQANDIADIEAEVQKIINLRNQELTSFQRITQCKVRKHPFQKTSSKKIIRPIYFDNKKNEAEKAASVRKPETDMQKQIYALVSGIMGNELFGIDDNLYDSGLDSMGSILLLEEFKNVLGAELTLNDLLENNTVLALEAFVADNKEKEHADYTVREKYPLTGLQKYFVYIIRGNTTGNLPFTFKLDNSVDLKRMKKAVEATIDAHPGLKGIIRLDMFAMFRDDSRKIEVPIIKLTDEEWLETQKKLVVPFAYTAEDNLVHTALYETDSAKYFFFDLSHAMGDGITMGILFNDINRAYAGEKLEKESYTAFEYALDEAYGDENGIRAKNIAAMEELMKDCHLTRSILNKKEMDEYSIGVNGVIRQRLFKVVRKKILYFCKKHGVSENVLFITALNYCMALFANEDDVFCNSIHSGRIEGRYRSVAGPLFRQYFCRYQRKPHRKTLDLLSETGKQIIDTMKISLSAARQGEMFFQFQGDILQMDEMGGAKAERIRTQLDSLPFHMQVMTDDKGYSMELRYWENRFDEEQLRIFIECFQYVINAILEEPSVRRLRKHIPEELHPKHFYISAGELNAEAGYQLVDAEPEEQLKVYVLDDREYLKKPYGGWGPLFIMDHKPTIVEEELDNPYGPGTLYRSDRIARILPDGTVDFLENGGRHIITDGIHGMQIFDLQKLEYLVLDFGGIEMADAYLSYDNTANEMTTELTIEAKKKIDTDALMEYIKANVEENLVPKAIHVVKVK